MNSIRWIHIAGGMIALLLGAVAIAVRKGGGVHVSAGTWVCVSVLVLGVTAPGLADLRFIIRGTLSPTQRISRHLWRMCFAFFVATGSFFLGQQKVMPHAVRGSPILFVLAFSPFALMLFWLVWVRFSKMISGLK